MTEPVIALVFDFDGTLGVDTITMLLRAHNIDPAVFWKQVDAMVKDGWDPPLAYMHLLLQHQKNGRIVLHKELLNNLGEDVVLFPGLPEAFVELRTFIKQANELQGSKINLEYYIISGGIEEMIVGSPVASYMNGIFGSSFAYDAQSLEPVGIKTTVSFTEKTRYIYGISKGLTTSDLRSNPYKINDSMPKENRRIPLSQMIYIGDGPSDIPCLSAIIQGSGTGIGVSAPSTTFKKG